MPGQDCSRFPVWGRRPKAVPRILAHRSPLGKGKPVESEGLREIYRPKKLPTLHSVPCGLIPTFPGHTVHTGRCFPGVLGPFRTPPGSVEVTVRTLLWLSHLLWHSDGELVIGYFTVTHKSDPDGSEEVLAKVASQAAQQSRTLALHVRQHDDIESAAQQKTDSVIENLRANLGKAHQAAVEGAAGNIQLERDREHAAPLKTQPQEIEKAAEAAPSNGTETNKNDGEEQRTESQRLRTDATNTLIELMDTTLQENSRATNTNLEEHGRTIEQDQTECTAGLRVPEGGVRNLFLACEPLVGWRHVAVTRRRTMEDFAHQMRWLVDEAYPETPVVRVVMDNLNTHCPASLYETFPAAEARRIAKRLEFHYTPKHGSWLNMAEIEFSVLSRSCLKRRLPDEETLRREVQALPTNLRCHAVTAGAD